MIRWLPVLSLFFAINLLAGCVKTERARILDCKVFPDVKIKQKPELLVAINKFTDLHRGFGYTSPPVHDQFVFTESRTLLLVSTGIGQTVVLFDFEDENRDSLVVQWNEFVDQELRKDFRAKDCIEVIIWDSYENIVLASEDNEPSLIGRSRAEAAFD